MDLENKPSRDGDADMDDQGSESSMLALKGSRNWLNMALKLYALLEYQDDRLFEHAKALVVELNNRLGPEEKQAGGGED
ncbi:hypothetical protein LTR53_019714, partial [Teratosphaeriaceae sp. CCFEE 6253]